jgi:hypothetical protein
MDKLELAVERAEVMRDGEEILGFVPSGSSEGVVYAVVIDLGGRSVSCSCPSGRTRGRCYHVEAVARRAVRDGLAGREEILEAVPYLRGRI